MKNIISILLLCAMCSAKCMFRSGSEDRFGVRAFLEGNSSSDTYGVRAFLEGDNASVSNARPSFMLSIDRDNTLRAASGRPTFMHSDTSSFRPRNATDLSTPQERQAASELSAYLSQTYDPDYDPCSYRNDPVMRSYERRSQDFDRLIDPSPSRKEAERMLQQAIEDKIAARMRQQQQEQERKQSAQASPIFNLCNVENGLGLPKITKTEIDKFIAAPHKPDPVLAEYHQMQSNTVWTNNHDLALILGYGTLQVLAPSIPQAMIPVIVNGGKAILSSGYSIGCKVVNTSVKTLATKLIMDSIFPDSKSSQQSKGFDAKLVSITKNDMTISGSVVGQISYDGDTNSKIEQIRKINLSLGGKASATINGVTINGQTGMEICLGNIGRLAINKIVVFHTHIEIQSGNLKLTVSPDGKRLSVTSPRTEEKDKQLASMVCDDTLSTSIP